MESAEQRLLRELRIARREYTSGMATWETWFAWRRSIVAEAETLGVTDKLLKLAHEQGGE